MKKKDSRIYLDYAASTPVDEQVVLAMKPYWSENFGNPGSIHKEGVRAKAAIDTSRKSIAATLGAKEDEIIFTGSGTEANNLAIYGVVNYLVHQKRDLSKMHFITSQIEHPSVLNLFQDLEARGARVTYIEVTPEGRVRPIDVMDALREDTVLVSIMFANNEIGTINQIANIARFIKAFRKQSTKGAYPYFHTDASQALIFSQINVETLGVDLLTIDAQKI
ncbi:aminotransferase class V-fold PLP-dependent enzyme, partial [Patescibacteria group bacterium]|nr:aminotransferase class V-fold PLP-dependent enzyme [Patescibacteria group bacterium]